MQADSGLPKEIDRVDDQFGRSGLLRTVSIVAACCVIAFAIRLAASFLVPILLGLWIAILALPIIAALRRRGLPRWAAIAIPTAGLVLVAAVVIYFVVSWIADLDVNLPTYQAGISDQRANLNAWLDDHGIAIPGASVDEQVNVEAVVALAKKILPSTVAVISGLGFAFLLFVFALLEADDAKRRLEVALGSTSQHLVRLSEFVDLVAKAILLRAVLGLAAAVGDGIVLKILDVPHVGLWMVVSFVCCFVPYVGYWIAMLPPLLIALAMHGVGGAVAVFLGYGLINGFFDSVVGPKFQGDRLNLSPLITIISVLFWGAVLGAVGGMLALPLTLGVKLLLLDAFPEGRWLSTVIEAGSPSDTTKKDS